MKREGAGRMNKLRGQEEKRQILTIVERESKRD